MESREVNLTSLLDTSGEGRYILIDQRNPLGQLQEKQANHHWTGKPMYASLMLSDTYALP